MEKDVRFSSTRSDGSNSSGRAETVSRTLDTMVVPRETPLPTSRVFPVKSWDRYEILSFLGAGGMGRVFQAMDPRLNRQVALKLLHLKDNDDPRHGEHFLREARAQARVEHPHICKVYEVGAVEGHPYIAMTYVDGPSLQKAKHEMSLEQKVTVMAEVSDALHAAHRTGLIHRDIKPANILVERTDTNEWYPYVMDFGLAQDVAPDKTVIEKVEGTPAYMAPEQAAAKRLDRRTDVYSLGATLYDLLTGRPPFAQVSGVQVLVAVLSDEPTPLRQLDKSVPPDLETIVHKCLEKEPSKRYESARALAEDLRRYLDGEPILARRATLGYRLLKTALKNKLLVAISATALATIVILGAVARSQAAEEARVAEELGQTVKEMEHFMRFAYSLPLHDIGREKAPILKRIGAIEALMVQSGKRGEGTGQYAVGCGYLALHEYDRARSHFQKAWDSNYRTPALRYSMGRALGELYGQALTEAARIPDVDLKKERLAQIEANYLKPALEHLREAKGADDEAGPSHYIAALVAFYSKDRDVALERARLAYEEEPWLFEAKQLEGNIQHQNGNEAMDRGDVESALGHHRSAIAAYVMAADIASSDADIYGAQADAWLQILEIELLGDGANAKAALEQCMAACDRALGADPQFASAYVKKLLAQFRWGQWLVQRGLTDDQSAMEALRSAVNMGELAVRMDPSDALAFDSIGNGYLILAMLGLEKGSDPTPLITTAVGHYKKSIATNPNFAWAWNDLGQAYFLRMNQEIARGQDPYESIRNAAEAYKQAIQVSEGRPYKFPYSNMGELYGSKASYELDHGVDPTASVDEATRASRKAIELNPAFGEPLLYVGMAWVVRARYEMDLGLDPRASLDEARNALQTARRIIQSTAPDLDRSALQTEWLGALHALAKGEKPDGELGRAEALLAGMLAARPKDPLNHLWKGRIDLLTARARRARREDPGAALDRARAAIARALSLDPGNAESHLTAAERCRFQAEWGIKQRDSARKTISEGLASVKEALRIHPHIPRAVALKGALHLLSAQLLEPGDEKLREAGHARDALEEALRLNQFLKREYGPLLTEAQKLIP